MVRYKKKQPSKSCRIAVTGAPPSAGNQSLGSVSRSTCSQQRLQNADTASLSASARTMSEAIADGDLSEKSNEDYDDKEEENDGDQGHSYFENAW
jgi:hypothetical protein